MTSKAKTKMIDELTALYRRWYGRNVDADLREIYAIIDKYCKVDPRENQ